MVAKLRNFIYYSEFDSDFCFSPILVPLDFDEHLTVFAIVERQLEESRRPWEAGRAEGRGDRQPSAGQMCPHRALQGLRTVLC